MRGYKFFPKRRRSFDAGVLPKRGWCRPSYSCDALTWDSLLTCLPLTWDEFPEAWVLASFSVVFVCLIMGPDLSLLCVLCGFGYFYFSVRFVEKFITWIPRIHGDIWWAWRISEPWAFSAHFSFPPILKGDADPGKVKNPWNEGYIRPLTVNTQWCPLCALLYLVLLISHSNFRRSVVTTPRILHVRWSVSRG